MLILFGIVVWRSRQRLSNHQQALQTLINLMHVPLLPLEYNNNENEAVEMTLLSGYKLPNYDEAVNDTRADQPLFREEENGFS